MTGDRLIVLQLSAIEVAQLTALVEQFTSLLGRDDEEGAADDPALTRLTPAAYPDDAAATEEFRRLTRGDLLARRSDDAVRMLGPLLDAGGAVEVDDLDDEESARSRVLALEVEEAPAWMRTITAIRLVLASRLGIESDGDADPADPRSFLYEWLGSVLEGIVQAVSAEGDDAAAPPATAS